MTKQIFLSFFTVSVLSTAFAEMPTARRGGFKKNVFEQLGLTPEQKTQLDALEAKKKTDLEKMQTERKALREKFQTALQNDASEEELRKLQKELVAEQTNSQNSRFENMLATRKILTKEQRKRMHELTTKGRGPQGGMFD